MKFLFIHLDMMFGGAEKLIMNIADILSKENNEVTIYCQEYKDKQQLQQEHNNIKFCEVPSKLPSHLSGYFHGLLNYIKYTVLCLYVLSRDRQQDCFVFDQIAFPMFLFKLFRKRTVYYCHFPDQLLYKPHDGGIYFKLYRCLMKFLEKFGMMFADEVICNSQYTLKKTQECFNINNNKIKILYPKAQIKNKVDKKSEEKFILTLNRFEENKKQDFLIETMIPLLQKYKKLNFYLVGGLNKKNYHDFEFFKQLENRIEKENVKDRIKFFVDVTDKQKEYFIQNCELILYPPLNEHFGIIPLEAVMLKKLIIAHKSGGPLETLISDYLIDEYCFKQWQDKIEEFLCASNDQKKELIDKNYELYQSKFSEKIFKREVLKIFLDHNI